jgi:hypothetical protein
MSAPPAALSSMVESVDRAKVYTINYADVKIIKQTMSHTKIPSIVEHTAEISNLYTKIVIDYNFTIMPQAGDIVHIVGLVPEEHHMVSNIFIYFRNAKNQHLLYQVLVQNLAGHLNPATLRCLGVDSSNLTAITFAHLAYDKMFTYGIKYYNALFVYLNSMIPLARMLLIKSFGEFYPHANNKTRENFIGFTVVNNGNGTFFSIQTNEPTIFTHKNKQITLFEKICFFI